MNSLEIDLLSVSLWLGGNLITLVSHSGKMLPFTNRGIPSAGCLENASNCGVNLLFFPPASVPFSVNRMTSCLDVWDDLLA